MEQEVDTPEINNILDQIKSLPVKGQEKIFNILKESGKYIRVEHKEDIKGILSADVDKLINEYENSLKNISDNPNLLERTSMVVHAIDLTNKLAKHKNPASYQIDIENFKKDMASAILFRYLKWSIKKSKNGEVVGQAIYEKLDEYNSKKNDELDAMHINSEEVELLKTHIDKMFLAGKFSENMYQYFVQDFLKAIENAKFGPGHVVQDDQSKILQEAINIALFASDFVEHFNQNDSLRYHKNLELILADMSLDRVDTREFIENDMAQSTRASNVIIKIMRDIWAKELKALVDKYYISPDDIERNPK